MSQRRSVISQPELTKFSNNSAVVMDCMRFIMGQEGSKIPIKRADIANHLMTVCEVEKSDVPAVIEATKRAFNEVQGYDLVKHNARTGCQYMVILSKPHEDAMPSSMEEEMYCIVLNVSLAHIFMSGGSVTEDDLWQFLIKAKLTKNDDYTAPKLLTKTLVSQAYLKCTKNAADNSINTFEWGPRAHAETTKMFILKKVAQALGKPPEYWSQQYKEALKELETESTMSNEHVKET